MDQAHLIKLLSKGRSGGAILFCGAGFSASSLGFESDENLGVGAHLLKLLNDGLKQQGDKGAYKLLPNAATKFITLKGEHGLLELLRDRFKVSHVAQHMVDILKFPWERVYTTNYDNSIELSCQRIPRKFSTFNNTDNPKDITHDLGVIHLHGHVEKWTIRNFRESCILDMESYIRLPSLQNWLRELKTDLERASVVVFAGFSASDFHLNRVFYNATGIRDKSIFINRPTAERDEDAYIQQEIYGAPLYVGIEGLASAVAEALQSPTPMPVRLASFKPFEAKRPANSLPSVESITRLFMLGAVENAQCARDVSTLRSDYHVIRRQHPIILQQISDGARIFLISGEVCDGKSLLIEDLAQSLSVSRNVYWLQQAYDDLLDEVAKILESDSTAVLVVENCFELRSERLSLLARCFDGSEAILLLSARSIAADAETGKIKSLKPLAGYREHRISELSDSEISDLEKLIDQFGGFAHLGAYTRAERERRIAKKNKRNLPNALLDVLKSEHVQARYREEMSKLGTADSVVSRILITCLFLKHIGDPPPASFISNIFSIDVASQIDILNKGNTSFHLLRIERGFVETVPAIGASILLREFYQDSTIVSSIIFVLERMAQDGIRSTEYERYAFNQMMRYSRLSTVVSSSIEIDRFFDHISKIDYFRGEPLFWLQWHMAKLADERFEDAERLLNRGYLEAANWERVKNSKYNRTQLDDRNSKFLIERAIRTNRSSNELRRDLQLSSNIIDRLLKSSEVTHHPYETMSRFIELFLAKSDMLKSDQRARVKQSCSDLLLRAERRLGNVPEGYQRNTAERMIRLSKHHLADGV